MLDIHGEHAWGDFLALLVGEGVLAEHAVANGLVDYHPIPEDDVFWRHSGYKPPSAAVKKAIAVARRHPNLAAPLAAHGAARPKARRSGPR